MSIKLSELYEGVKGQKIDLVSGKGGIDNIVKWVHMVETEELTLFLDGQEVAFTTGIGLKNEGDLFNLVRYTYDNNASGMVINTGPFIEEIPEEIIKFSDEKDFPIFEVPWSVHLAEIMRKFCYKITQADRTHMELINALKNAIFFQDQRELYVPHLERHSFRANWPYCLVVIDIINRERKKKVEEWEREKYIKVIENQVLRKHDRIFQFEVDERIVLVFPKYSEERIKKIMVDIKERLNRQSKKKDDIYICIGKVAKNIYCIGKSYRKALEVLNLQKRKGAKEEIVTYNDLGIYKLLLSVEDKELKKEFYLETIEPLIRYDELNDTDYQVVLKSYLDHSGSVKEVAKELFYHRNTINYKLKKIEEILECDLSSLDSRLLYGVALMLYDIM